MDCQTGAFRHALSISFQKKKINQKITYMTVFKKKGEEKINQISIFQSHAFIS